MRPILILASSIAILSSFAQPAFAIPKPKASAKATGITRTVAQFNEINAGGNTMLIVHVGQPLHVIINAAPQVAKCMLTDLNGKMLYIHRLSTPQCQSQQPVQLTINTPELSGMMTHGTNSSTVTGIHSRAFMLYSSGSSHLTLSGQTDSINAVVSGESSLDAKKFQTNSALINAAGNTQVIVNTNDVLFVQASGNAQTTYTGKPKKIIKALNGSSSLTPSS